MLREFTALRQEAQGFRRLFCDDEFDLYAWYETHDGPLFGFQLVYFEEEQQKALTWTRAEGYHHHAVEGWDSHRFNETPVLTPDGTFAPQSLLARLTGLLGEVDPEVRNLVLAKITDFPTT